MGIGERTRPCLDGNGSDELLLYYSLLRSDWIRLGLANTKMSKDAVKRARKRLANWSARGGSCPLCHKDFRYGCNHSVEQARQRLEANIVNALVDRRLKKLKLI